MHASANAARPRPLCNKSDCRYYYYVVIAYWMLDPPTGYNIFNVDRIRLKNEILMIIIVKSCNDNCFGCTKINNNNNNK